MMRHSMTRNACSSRSLLSPTSLSKRSLDHLGVTCHTMSDYTTSSESDSEGEGFKFVATCSSAMQKRLSSRGLAVPGREVRTVKHKGEKFLSATPFRRCSIHGNTTLPEETAVGEEQRQPPQSSMVRRNSMRGGFAEACLASTTAATTATTTTASPRRTNSSARVVARRSSVGSSLPTSPLAEVEKPKRSTASRRASMGGGGFCGASSSSGGRRMTRRSSMGGGASSTTRRLSAHGGSSTRRVAKQQQQQQQQQQDFSKASLSTEFDVDCGFASSNDFVTFDSAFASVDSADCGAFKTQDGSPDYGYGDALPDTTDYGYGDDNNHAAKLDAAADFYGYGYDNIHSHMDRQDDPAEYSGCGDASKKNDYGYVAVSASNTTTQVPPAPTSPLSSKGRRTTKVPRRKSLAMR